MPPKHGVCRCSCGHEILLDDDYESYALIPERDYRELITNEAHLFATEDDESDERAGLFSRQADRIGSLIICPKCSLLNVHFPVDSLTDDSEYHRYFRECE